MLLKESPLEAAPTAGGQLCSLRRLMDAQWLSSYCKSDMWEQLVGAASGSGLRPRFIKKDGA